MREATLNAPENAGMRKGGKDRDCTLRTSAIFLQRCSRCRALFPMRLGESMPSVDAKPTLDEIWQWLEDVPDPEIPVVSVVDLGIVRDAAWDDETLTVTVTPTYSGCPATAVISFEIEEALRRHGVENLRIETRLSPAWTTQWISEAGREKLKAYGIAPPVDRCSMRRRVAIAEGCQSSIVLNAAPRKRNVSASLDQPRCKAHYRCKTCLEPFDYFKSF